eukprot:1158022-Pelagomonas_calceolata.AAC.3
MNSCGCAVCATVLPPCAMPTPAITGLPDSSHPLSNWPSASVTPFSACVYSCSIGATADLSHPSRPACTVAAQTQGSR